MSLTLSQHMHCWLKRLGSYKPGAPSITAPIAPGTSHVPTHCVVGPTPDLITSPPPARTTSPVDSEAISFDGISDHTHGENSARSPANNTCPPTHCDGLPTGAAPASVIGISAGIPDPQYRDSSELSLINSEGNIFGRTIESVTNIRVGGNYNEINIYSFRADDPAPPTLPDVLHRNLQNNSRLLLPILGVALAFRAPPSLLQISRVLGLEWTDVRDALKPISAYLERLDWPINPSSDVRLPQFLADFLLRRTGTLWIDPAKYHAILACWCLTGKRALDARDIVNTEQFWADHVCHSTPSAEVYEALRASCLPLDPVSRAKLPDLVFWLETQGSQAPDLISTYRESQSQPPKSVRVMNGRLNMSF